MRRLLPLLLLVALIPPPAALAASPAGSRRAARPHIQVSLRKTLHRGSTQVVTAMATIGSRATVSYTVPREKRARRHAVRLGEGGAFVFTFRVGSHPGVGRVRVCVSERAGSACTSWLRYRVR